MLKCSITRGGETCSVISSGNIVTLASDISYIVSKLYGSIKYQNPDAAEAFKEVVVTAVIHPDSPVWDVPDKGKDGGEE